VISGRSKSLPSAEASASAGIGAVRAAAHE
jgi:hypothetical protein